MNYDAENAICACGHPRFVHAPKCIRTGCPCRAFTQEGVPPLIRDGIVGPGELTEEERAWAREQIAK